MHHRHRTGGEGIEGSGDDELAVVVSSEVAECGDLNIHEEFDDLGCKLALRFKATRTGLMEIEEIVKPKPLTPPGDAPPATVPDRRRTVAALYERRCP